LDFDALTMPGGWPENRHFLASEAFQFEFLDDHHTTMQESSSIPHGKELVFDEMKMPGEWPTSETVYDRSPASKSEEHSAQPARSLEIYTSTAEQVYSFSLLHTHRLRSVSKDEVILVDGFSNDTPGDTAIVDTTCKYNLVSSAWVDFRRFPLYQTNETHYLELGDPGGISVACYGLISGTWTDRSLERCYVRIEAFVVDALFAIPGSSGCYYFLFGANTLSKTYRVPCKG
jgi:hypothetical protein